MDNLREYINSPDVKKLADYLRNMSVRNAADFIIGWTPEYKTLADAQAEMERVKKDGYDNYAHRLAMCRIGQMGAAGSVLSPRIGEVLGWLKEFDDTRKKSIIGNKPWKETLYDFWKDINNDYEGLNYGLTHPNADCRIWLKDLDYENNEWKKNEDF